MRRVAQGQLSLKCAGEVKVRVGFDSEFFIFGGDDYEGVAQQVDSGIGFDQFFRCQKIHPFYISGEIYIRRRTQGYLFGED